MTAQEAITRADALKPNAVPEAEKLRWLASLEGQIKNEIVDTHEGWDVPLPAGEKISPDDALFVPPPYEEVYVFWIMAKIDFTNGEFESFGNSKALFNSTFSAYAEHVNRTMTPKSSEVKYG